MIFVIAVGICCYWNGYLEVLKIIIVDCMK